MTKEQASKRFGVPLAKLQTYEKQGLFDCHRQRQKLLADIHSKQKSLDQLDYIIFDTNKATGSAV